MHKTQHDALNDKDKILTNMCAESPFGTFFGISQKIFDQVWTNITAEDGNSGIYVSMEIGADWDVYNPVKKFLQDNKMSGSSNPVLADFTNKFLTGPAKIPNYGGGLGILAGDTLKSFAACKIPVAAISLLYRKGYFSQLVDSRIGQITWSADWDPEKTPGLYLLKNPGQPEQPLIIEIPFFDEVDETVMAYAQIWMKLEINENLDFFVPEFLMDYGVPESPEWIQEAANHLYDSSSEKMKAIQRRMLGAGVVPLMEIHMPMF